MTENEILNPYAREFGSTAESMIRKTQVLQQVMEEAHIEVQTHSQRGRCCQITFAWCYGFRDMFAWFKALWHLNDDQLIEICGTDYTLYLIFLRMSAILCFVITIFNGVVMVPIYLTGEPMASDDYKKVDTISKMSAATVLNITSTPSKMIFAYVCAVVVIPGLAITMIYKFR